MVGSYTDYLVSIMSEEEKEEIKTFLSDLIFGVSNLQKLYFYLIDTFVDEVEQVTQPLPFRIEFSNSTTYIDVHSKTYPINVFIYGLSIYSINSFKLFPDNNRLARHDLINDLSVGNVFSKLQDFLKTLEDNKDLIEFVSKEFNRLLKKKKSLNAYVIYKYLRIYNKDLIPKQIDNLNKNQFERIKNVILLKI